MGKPTLQIYTRSICGDCQSLKKFLRENGISFQLFELDNNPNKEREMIALTGNKIVPTLVFKTSKFFKTKQEVLIGFEQNKERIKGLLNIQETAV